MCSYYVSRAEGMASGTHPDLALRESTHKRRRIKKRCKSGKYVEDVTLEELLEHTHLPSGLAAQKLGLGITVFKKLCRKRGLARWPYQKPNQQPEMPPGLLCSTLDDSDCSQDSQHGSQSSGQTTGQAQGCLGLLLSAATEAEGSASGRSQRTSSQAAVAADKAATGSIMELAKVLSTNPVLARQLADAMDTLTKESPAGPALPAAAASAFAPQLPSAFTATAPFLGPLSLHDARCVEWSALHDFCAVHSADSLHSAGSAFVPYTPFAASLQHLGATLPPSPCAVARDFPAADVLPHSAWVAAYTESLQPALMPRLQPGGALHSGSLLPQPPTPPQSNSQQLLVPPLPTSFATAAAASGASAAPIAEGLAQLEQLQRLQQLMALQREQQRQQTANAERGAALGTLRPAQAPGSVCSPWLDGSAAKNSS